MKTRDANLSEEPNIRRLILGVWGIRIGETSCDVRGSTGVLGEDWRWGGRDEHTNYNGR